MKRSFVAETAIRQSRTTAQHGAPVIRQKDADDGAEPKPTAFEKAAVCTGNKQQRRPTITQPQNVARGVTVVSASAVSALY